ncbi:hypothetical protein MNBD_ALPHA09-1653 [hydrothermal vent metagenome]|uniref:Uncharacterized protein n=1 Tax=hydrothermal vent metagenome TaxID=652676 RepID=A0A3B0TH54_9ZZZZ
MTIRWGPIGAGNAQSGGAALGILSTGAARGDARAEENGGDRGNG